VHRLRVFRSVVASGSIQAAASHLGYTPSAVSQHVAALQRETGLILLEKVGRGIAPTAAGRFLAESSEEAMDALARLDGLVDSLRDGHLGTVSIACFASAGEEWIPLLARRLRQEFAVPLDVTLNEVVVDPLPSRADLDIRTEDPAEPPPHLPGYTRHELLVEPYLAVVPSDHRLADRGRIKLGELADEPLVAENEDHQVCWHLLQRALRGAGITPRVAARCQDHHTAMAMTAAGLGFTLVPRLAAGALPAGCRPLSLSDPEPERRIVTHVRDTARLNPAVERAVELLHAIAAEAEAEAA
jgi:DNA-binding transcriptional LysR family regulator